MKTVRIEIWGRVQGVNFRGNTSKKCLELELKGYVCNRDDGSVLAVIQGNSERIKELEEWMRGGPGLSKVERIRVQEVTAKFYYDDFKLVREESLIEDQRKALGNLLKGKKGSF